MEPAPDAPTTSTSPRRPAIRRPRWTTPLRGCFRGVSDGVSALVSAAAGWSRRGSSTRLSLGLDRRAVGDHRADAPADQGARPDPEALLPRHPGRDLVHRPVGVFLAAAPGGLPTLADRLRLV